LSLDRWGKLKFYYGKNFHFHSVDNQTNAEREKNQTRALPFKLNWTLVSHSPTRRMGNLSQLIGYTQCFALQPSKIYAAVMGEKKGKWKLTEERKMQEALLRTVQLDTTSQPEVAAFHTIFPPADLSLFCFPFDNLT